MVFDVLGQNENFGLLGLLALDCSCRSLLWATLVNFGSWIPDRCGYFVV